MHSQVRATSSGALAEFSIAGLSLLQYPATELEPGPANLWLRVREGDRVVRAHALTGPASRSAVVEGTSGPAVCGSSDGVDYLAWFHLASDGGTFGWSWRLQNRTERPVIVDLLWTLDVALTPIERVRTNEYYVSQYLDLTPISVADSTALAVRQNLPGTGAPWVALGSSAPVRGWGTDARQLLDRTRGAGLDPTRDLTGERLQHEHTLAALQTDALPLAPDAEAEGLFWGVFVEQHPEASGADDGVLVAERLAAAHWPAPPDGPTCDAVPTVFSPAKVAAVREGSITEPSETGLRLPERDEKGAVLSGFVDDRHVVAAVKERQVLRPHGAILHRQPSPIADASGLAATVWMSGVFGAQLTASQASGGELVSIRRSYLGLTEAAGIRIFVGREDEGWRLLATPTSWEVSDDRATWNYLLDDAFAGVGLTVKSELSNNRELTLGLSVSGQNVDVLVVIGDEHGGAELNVDGGIVSGDEPLFAAGKSRGLDFRTVCARDTSELEVRLRVPTDSSIAQHHVWRVPRLAGAGETAALSEFLRWMAHDAAVHFQMPRGLEQFTGGAWGTRDVCQGPVGLLLATDELGALRTTLLTVFAAQRDNGSWPQSFEFLPGEVSPGQAEAHGDVVYWPLLALGEYLVATGDVAILPELRQPITRAVEHLLGQRTRDERLPAYGHGDWNDSLQPAHPELAQSMCSTWTAELEIHALRTLATGLGQAWPEMAGRLTSISDRTEEAFGELIVDGELAGYAVMGEAVEHLVHPRDERTGLKHGLLHMIHAISGELFTPEQASIHAALIREHLLGPTGAYLFDAPVAYSGGPMTVFQRAEAATFWGREIGLMYTHAHLRYVEALTHLGEGSAAWDELLKVAPIGLPDRVPGASRRQANSYFSSSDAAFPDRYRASDQAEALFESETHFDGGWRVYSSGPGLILRLVTQKLLGVRPTATGLEIDPVLPVKLDGLRAEIPVSGQLLNLTFHIGAREHGVDRVRIGGRDIETQPLVARYRKGGVRLPVPWGVPGDGEDALDVEVWLGGESEAHAD